MNRIKQLREEIGMTQVRLSIELEVAQETVSAYEHNKHYPSVATLIKMTKLFHASIDYILGFSDVRNPASSLLEEEEALLAGFKTLSKSNQGHAVTYIRGLLAAQDNRD